MLAMVAVLVLAVPAAVGAHYYYADSGYYTTTYETREVSEYVPYQKYVCDEDHYPRYEDYGYYGYGYENYRNCYYKTDYVLETRTVKVPVRKYVQSNTYNYSSHTRRVYDVPSYYQNDRYDYYYNGRNTKNVVNYYGYYYGI
jgi:hypothetical protein